MATTYDYQADENGICAQAARKETEDMQAAQEHEPTVAPSPSGGGKSARKRGAPLNNANRTTHGMRSLPPRHGFQVGGVPRGANTARLALMQLRRSLEDEVVAVHGTITLTQAALIASAMRHERVSQLALKWLKDEGAKLDVDKRLTLVKEIALSSDRRDKCLDPWATLTLPVAPLVDAEKAPSPPCDTLPTSDDNAAGANVANKEGNRADA